MLLSFMLFASAALVSFQTLHMEHELVADVFAGWSVGPSARNDLSFAKNSLPGGYSEGTLKFRGSIGNIDNLELEGRDIQVLVPFELTRSVPQLRLLNQTSCGNFT